MQKLKAIERVPSRDFAQSPMTKLGEVLLTSASHFLWQSNAKSSCHI